MADDLAAEFEAGAPVNGDDLAKEFEEAAPVAASHPVNPGVAARQANAEAYRAAVARMKAREPEQPGDRQFISGGGMAKDLMSQVYPGQDKNRQLAAGAGLTFGALPRLRALARSAFGPETYEHAKKEEFADLAKANEAEPETAGLGTALSMSVPLPGIKALEGPGALRALARIAERGAEGAAINAVGGSDDASLLRRLAVGGLVGTGGGVLSEGFGALASRGADKVRKAEADAAEIATNKARKADVRASGSEGGITAAVTDAYRKAREIVDRGVGSLHSAQDVANAQALLDDPDFVKEAAEAYRNTIARAHEKMGSLKTAQAVRETTQKALEPESIEAAADELLKDPITKQVLPRAIRYAKRLPVAIGALAGPAGAFAGEQVANRLGDIGTSSANAARSPAMRKLVGNVERGVGEIGVGGVEALRRLIPLIGGHSSGESVDRYGK